MFLANASTKRPIAMGCLLIALVVLGLNSARKLSIEDMPAVDIPYIAVITTWVGASPEDVEKDVSKYIEDAVSGIDGLKHIESSSLENVSQVVLEFNLSVDVDTAAQDVREKLDPILSKLPAEKATELVFYCNGSPCWKGYKGAIRAIETGYTHVHWYRDGMLGWGQALYPVE